MAGRSEEKGGRAGKDKLEEGSFRKIRGGGDRDRAGRVL